MSKIDRTPISTRLVEALEKDIIKGVWTKTLPGYRILSRHYGVSRAACDAAFSILEERGLLAEAEPRKQRRILSNSIPPSKTAHKRAKNLLIIIDNAHLDDEAPLLTEIKKYWLRNFGEVREDSEYLAHYKNPCSRLMRVIEREKADCLLLHVAPSPWIDAASTSGLPFHLLGGSFTKTVPHPSGSGYRMVTNYERILERLVKLEHRKILSPSHLQNSSFRAAILSAHAKILGGRESDYEDLVLEFREPEPKTWQSYWHKAFLHQRPSAVIVQNAKALLSLYGYCYTQRIQIPAELSVICISSESELEWVHPLPTRMRYPYEKAARNFQNWARRGFRDTVFKHFDLEWIEGQSIAPAARQNTLTR